MPVAGRLFGNRIAPAVWIGALTATVGLFLLTVPRGAGLAAITPGDLLVAIGTLFWTAHVLYLVHVSPGRSAVELAVGQYAVCAIVSLVGALLFETIEAQAIWSARGAILYGGLASVGIAYTLQIVGQRYAPPSHAAIILSLEAAFAALGGWLLLAEPATGRAIIACVLMLTGMVVSQLRLFEPH